VISPSCNVAASRVAAPAAEAAFGRRVAQLSSKSWKTQKAMGKARRLGMEGILGQAIGVIGESCRDSRQLT